MAAKDEPGDGRTEAVQEAEGYHVTGEPGPQCTGKWAYAVLVALGNMSLCDIG